MSQEGPHNLPGAPPLLHTMENALAKVWFYENIVLVEVAQGVNINYKNTFDLIVKGINYVDYKPWVYISHRRHPYEVDPKFYKYINLIPYLKGMAIVYPEGIDETFEVPDGDSIQKKVAVFDNLPKAYHWALALLGKTTQ
ncbi:MAG: hypothetical protein KTR22_04400 [Flavobacteriaceae bacterium]|nr:hypothetical protein [Flavobacteriaceae bacterium]